MRQFRCFAQACNCMFRLEASVSPCHRLSPVPTLSGYGLPLPSGNVHFMSSVLTTKEIDEPTLIQVIITPTNASQELIELLCGLLEKDPAMRLGITLYSSTQQLQGAVQPEEQLIFNTWCSSSGYPDGNPGNTQLMPDTQNGCARLRGLDNEPSSPFINMSSVLSLLWTPCITIVSFANLKYMFANLLLHCLAFFIETYYRCSYSIPI
ncbi:hypothetical protein EMCRGX_G002827 [Ephydatia muelleri]